MTVEHIEVLFTILISVAFGVSGTSFGEALRDRRAVKALALDNERAILNVNRALRNEALRLSLFLAFGAWAVRSLYLPKASFPRGQLYVTLIFVLVILAKMWGTVLDRRDRIWEMQPLYAEPQVQKALDEIKAEVVTRNESTIGSLAADNETRRIEAIPPSERTAKEQRHIDAAPAKDPAQGRH